MNKNYFDEIASKLNSSNLYSIFLYYYNYFHWSSGPVKGLIGSITNNNMKIGAPFHDYNVIDFLSQMPEDWGRGLDFRRTKFPLKWVLEEKLKFPMHLQSGPHSYLYDIDPSWSAIKDIMYGSAAVSFFIEILNSKSYKDILDPKYFDYSYVDSLIKAYSKKEELDTIRLNDLSYLLAIVNIGWH